MQTQDDDDAEQVRVWEILYARLKRTLDKLGREDWRGRADYWLISDNWGSKQHKLYITNLDLLAPSVVKQLQNTLAGFPDWEIVVAVYLEEKGYSWPDMGLIVRGHEIIDELQRQYFPTQYQGIKYDGSRHGP